MFNSFAAKADLTPCTLAAPRINLNVKNTGLASGAQNSRAMDFSGYDKADADTLTRILRHSIQGVDIPMPAPVTSAHLRADGTSLRTAHTGHDADD